MSDEHKIRVYGSSDDLIEIEGEITEEFNVYLEDGDTVLLAFSNGTLLRSRYDEDGIWLFDIVTLGYATVRRTENKGSGDEMELISAMPFRWVVMAKDNADRHVIARPGEKGMGR